MPKDLTRAIRLAADKCRAGSLRHLGDGACGDSFPLLAKTESWGDFVNSYFVAPEECSRACSSAAFALIRAC